MAALALSVAFCLGACGGTGAWDDEDAAPTASGATTPPVLGRAEARGRSGAARPYGAPAGEVQRLANTLLPEVARVVGLAVLRPVEAVEIDRTELRALLARNLTDFVTTAVDADEAAYLDHMQDRVLGLYDPADRRLVLVEGLAPQERLGTLRHELTHALQDQHFGLAKLQAAADYSIDAAQALNAVVEGQAMVAMEVQGSATPFDGRDTRAGLLAALKPRPLDLPARAGSLAGQLMAAARPTGMHGPLLPQLRGEPSPRPVAPLLQMTGLAAQGGPYDDEVAQLIFPYVFGQRFIAALTRAHNLPDVVRLTLDFVPTSTHEIMHPAAYVHGESPLEFELAALSHLPGHPLRWQNTLGEFTARLMLEDAPQAAYTASQWRGDKVLLLGGFAEADATVWVSAWRTPQAAVRFGRALLAAQTRKARSAGAGAGDVYRTLTHTHVFYRHNFAVVLSDVDDAGIAALRRAIEEDLLRLSP